MKSDSDTMLFEKFIFWPDTIEVAQWEKTHTLTEQGGGCLPGRVCIVTESVGGKTGEELLYSFSRHSMNKAQRDESL